jgi:hypothetical protein
MHSGIVSSFSTSSFDKIKVMVIAADWKTLTVHGIVEVWQT